MKRTKNIGKIDQDEQEIPVGLVNDELGKKGLEQAKKRGRTC